MSASLEEARAALRQRQGGGARYDAANAPARELDWARRGTAYFTRLLNGLPDAELDATSDWNPVSRRQLVVLAAYHARMLAELVAWARENRTGPLPRPARVEKAELAWGMTLPDHALRNLVQHAIIHLDVEWRDLGDAGWDRNVTDSEGRSVTVRETPQWRARLLWMVSMRLRAGGRRADVPAGLGEVLRETDPTELLPVS
ncbi:MAG: maleylpyruvate isomerase N-terminal domain-containing protein [Rhizobiaceae bacterium]|nr:maleylpyruvate isomerase N-terminal domain-containing protein [Rhizobiaceae bacterium]MCV0407127.1 maleylpyruvate isomerase N-terminal domain-containing protein [Rhizobiaceae bacterium]